MPRMRAAVLHAPRDIRVEDVDIPEIQLDEVLVQVKITGISESDIHFFKNGNFEHPAMEGPLTAGRLTSGVVAGIGTDVTDLHAGDHVAVEPGFPCLECGNCRENRYDLCPEILMHSCLPPNVLYPELIAVPAGFAHRLPERISFEEGAMVQIVATGVHAAERADISLAHSVGVLGAGAVGLAVLQAMKARGATRIVYVDRSESRLETARRLGATETVNFAKADPVAAVNDMTGGAGLDVVFDTAGTLDSLQQAFGMVKCRGVVALAGNESLVSTEIPIIDIITKELDVRGVFRRPISYPIAIDLIGSRAIDVRPLITHRFPLERVQGALEFADQHKDSAITVVLEM